MKLDSAFLKCCLYPMLFAISPVLSVFIANQHEVSPADLLLPVGLVVVLSAGVFLLLHAALRNSNKSALYTLLLVGLIYLGQDIGAVLMNVTDYLVINLFVILSLLGLIIVLMIRLERRKAVFGTVSNYLFIVATLLTVAQVVMIVVNHVRADGPVIESAQTSAQPEMNQSTGADPVMVGDDQLPDIYYIITDARASSQTLKSIYQYDDSATRRALEESGFMVSEKACTNYTVTKMVMNAILSGDYVHDENGAATPAVVRDGYAMLDRFSSLGYQTKLIMSGFYQFIYISDHFDVYSAGEVTSEFNNVLLKKTIFYQYLVSSINKKHRDSILFALDALQAEPTQRADQPRLILGHIVSPHHPFVFNRDGSFSNELQASELSLQQRTRAYLDQLYAIDERLIDTVRAILRDSDHEPIIVIHSDHGSNPLQRLQQQTITDQQSTAFAEAVRERASIFSAIYLPDRYRFRPPAAVTPVNYLRSLFELLTGTPQDHVVDRVYTSNFMGNWGLVDVTDLVGCHQPAWQR